MLLIALVAVFIEGFMLGRTPEYLGKKIEGREMKMVMWAMISCPACILLCTASGTLLRFRHSGYSVVEPYSWAGHARRPVLYFIPALAIAGSLAMKRRLPPTSGIMPTHNLQFSLLLFGTLIIVAALTFLPAFALGPMVEQFSMNAGRVF